MPGEDKAQQQTQQNSTTQPWAPAIPLLTDLLKKIGGGSTDVTGAQSSASDKLLSSVGSIPNFGGQSSDALSKLFSSSTAPQVGMLSDAYKTLNNNIGGTASGAELDPYKTPGFSDSLATLTKDITNKVKGVYAGSGRDPSGAGSFSGSLARGLTEGEAPVLASQFNQNKAAQMSAANSLFGAGGTTAGAITGQNQVPLTNASAALGLVPSAAGNYAAPGTTQLGAANTAFGLPWANLQAMLSPATAIAGLGGQSTGSGTTTTTQEQNPLSNIIGGAAGGLGLLKLLIPSDERLKDDVEEVGRLHDGQQVVRFRYKGQPETRIGLLAQDVAEVEPSAVEDIGAGILAVDHKRATDRAAALARRAA